MPPSVLANAVSFTQAIPMALGIVLVLGALGGLGLLLRAIHKRRKGRGRVGPNGDVEMSCGAPSGASGGDISPRARALAEKTRDLASVGVLTLTRRAERYNRLTPSSNGK